MQDILRVFKNCYVFNQNEDDVSLMAKNVENLIKEKAKAMPQEVEDRKEARKNESKHTWEKGDQ